MGDVSAENQLDTVARSSICDLTVARRFVLSLSVCLTPVCPECSSPNGGRFEPASGAVRNQYEVESARTYSEI